MPVGPDAIQNPPPIAMLLAPARPLPSGPERPTSNRPQTGDADAPIVQRFQQSGSVRIRGPIGKSASVGGNSATIGAPGVLGMAQQHAASAKQAARGAIGRNVDARA